jgi:hypothetical protein
LAAAVPSTANWAQTKGLRLLSILSMATSSLRCFPSNLGIAEGTAVNIAITQLLERPIECLRLLGHAAHGWNDSPLLIHLGQGWGPAGRPAHLIPHRHLIFPFLYCIAPSSSSMALDDTAMAPRALKDPRASCPPSLQYTLSWICPYSLSGHLSSEIPDPSASQTLYRNQDQCRSCIARTPSLGHRS